MIRGIGIDIIEVSRIRAMMRKHPEAFLERVFTQGERDYCSKYKSGTQQYAARFAAKEAAMKALGTGLASGIQWTDIEVSHDPQGRPIVLLHGEAAKIAKRLKIKELQISLTHVKSVAVASVVAVG